MQLTRISEHGAVPSIDQPEQKIVLVVDPDSLVLEAGKLLLSDTFESVQTACTCFDVSRLTPEHDPEIAFLSDRLGPFQVEAIAECVGNRWPRARILVVGGSAPIVEAEFSDEVVAAVASNLEFLAALEECAQSPDRARVN